MSNSSSGSALAVIFVSVAFGLGIVATAVNTRQNEKIDVLKERVATLERHADASSTAEAMPFAKVDFKSIKQGDTVSVPYEYKVPRYVWDRRLMREVRLDLYNAFCLLLTGGEATVVNIRAAEGEVFAVYSRGQGRERECLNGDTFIMPALDFAIMATDTAKPKDPP